jgi:uncharacterized membrane protein
MAVYMGADHVVWATTAGVVSDTAIAKGDRSAFYQKVSLWSWFAASAAAALQQTGDLTRALDEMSACGDTEDAEDLKREAAKRARGMMKSIVTSSAQAFLALALLEKTPFVKMSKRSVGALGFAVSVANCLALVPPRKSKTA